MLHPLWKKVVRSLGIIIAVHAMYLIPQAVTVKEYLRLLDVASQTHIACDREVHWKKRKIVCLTIVYGLLFDFVFQVQAFWLPQCHKRNGAVVEGQNENHFEY